MDISFGPNSFTSDDILDNLDGIERTQRNDTSRYQQTGHNPNLEGFYETDNLEWTVPPPLINNKYEAKEVETSIKGKDGKIKKIKKKEFKKTGSSELSFGSNRKAKPSIFNRYSLFFFNNTHSSATTPENYLDSPNRIESSLQALRWNPTTKNIIEWSKSGTTNAVEYAAEDFLWCKKLNQVPNNYLVTLRRFGQPCNDDLFDKSKSFTPDIARMLTWVDGVDLKWENVGLKWTHGMTYIKQTADAQSFDKTGYEGGGAEANILGGGMMGKVAKVATAATSSSDSSKRLNNQSAVSLDPYADKNKIYGPIDVVMEQWVREKGLTFEQNFDLKFEYELRSINNINPRVAFVDLMSNILLMTSNKGKFWGGERRFFGGDVKKTTPFGDQSELENGNMKGYLKSIAAGFESRMNDLSGGKGFSMENFGDIVKNIVSNLGAQLGGGMMDAMGRPQHRVIDSLLSGDDIGEWHVMVGNPANPIISIGNLILKETEVEFGGVLGPDDFPTKLIVTCKLQPARPRERLDMMSMFSRNQRTYLTTLPTPTKSNSSTIIKPNKNKNNVSNLKEDLFGDATANKFDDLRHRFTGWASSHTNDIENIKIKNTANNIG